MTREIMNYLQVTMGKNSKKGNTCITVTVGFHFLPD